MQFINLSVALSIASAVAAKTVYVTQVHQVTVYGDESQPEATPVPAVNIRTVTIEGANNNNAPTTLVTKTSSAQEEAVQTEAVSTIVEKVAAATSAAASTVSTSSDSGIYAEIAQSDVDASFAKAILDAHNQDRAAHSAPALSWSAEVYAYAKAYADKYDCSGNLVHSGGQYGENLAYGSGSMSGPAAVQMWYDEGETYDYSAANTYDHFTQVVWKSTTKLGCAQNTCGGSGTYIICSYDPAGNFIGNSKANVLPN